MSSNIAGSPSQGEHPHICFLNPALLPGWFWLPTAHLMQEQGYDYSIPNLQRRAGPVTAEESLDNIDEAMRSHDAQFVVALSRGIEFAVRYLDRIAKRDELGKIVGCMIISSVGPRGYEPILDQAGQPLPRHFPDYTDGLRIDENGFEILSPATARSHMLHGIADPQLLDIAVEGLSPERPLSEFEVTNVPRLRKNIVPMSWYIGLDDKVDNTTLSAAIAQEEFGVTPIYTTWGHVGPLTHTVQVSQAIATEIQDAHIARQAQLS